jgi:hypothetical protein
VRAANAQADADHEILRISVDTKATVIVGDYSRHGRSRSLQPVKAWDHDMRPKEKLVPGGILEPVSGRASLFFSGSYKTSDFIVDGLLSWWAERKESLANIKGLVINMDNGPECSGRRSQFLKRMVEFADTSGLKVRLVYYPPYHSKYNGIERYWAGLEKSWNGYLLSTVKDVLNRAANGKALAPACACLKGSMKKGSGFVEKTKQSLNLDCYARKNCLYMTSLFGLKRYISKIKFP